MEATKAIRDTTKAISVSLVGILITVGLAANWIAVSADAEVRCIGRPEYVYEPDHTHELGERDQVRETIVIVATQSTQARLQIGGTEAVAAARQRP